MPRARAEERLAGHWPAILDAARVLFTERGYAATAMTAIADRAGVALDTVYASVGRKPQLARLLIETAISGTDQVIPPGSATT
jgi:AcrR family transcriptional regulator